MVFDVNKHKFFMVQILKDIYSDIFLAGQLGFKGGTALMFFYDLPRFSVDLDFNLIDKEHAQDVYDKVEQIISKYGKIKDSAIKRFGILHVLDYGAGHRNMKVEVSIRRFDDSYEVKDFLGINVRVMKEPDMFAHKLCALLDRSMMAGRDVFDCWFFMQKRTSINQEIVKSRTGLDLSEYLEKCIEAVLSFNVSSIMNGVGELIDEQQRIFVRNRLKDETVSLMKMYQKFPL